jgi:NADPH:quinone reductase
MAGVTAEDRVLVLGASGGVGLPTVTLAASLGATVWGQTGNPSKTAAVEDAGATNVLVAGADGLTDAVGDYRPTVVFDPLGDGFTPGALAAMAQHGRLVVFGTSAGPEVQLNLQHVYRNGIRILGYTGLLLTADQRRRGLEQALAALADGRLRVPVGRALALDAVNDAFRLLADRQVTGKVVLDLS